MWFCLSKKRLPKYKGLAIKLQYSPLSKLKSNPMLKDLFTYPFLIGINAMFIIVIYRFTSWFIGLSKFDKIRIWKSIRTKKTIHSLKAAFAEGLLHRSIYKKQFVLGYMHMSLALGWFMLIVMGHVETILYEKSLAFPFHLPIFFRYFVHGHGYYGSKIMAFIMDTMLLLVLSGVLLAWLKRIFKMAFGMRRTTKLKPGDQIAMTSLWLIFPLRFLAESITAGLHFNGSYVTQTTGNIFSHFLPLHLIETTAWAAYSLSLGFFFVALPYSRYMHIPTEIFFIFLRNSGIKLKKRVNAYTNVQVFSCSRCGICLDSCQLNDAGIGTTQSVYMLKKIRDKKLTDELLFNCLLCGRCQHDCPVGIELNDLRITQRIESTLQYNSTYDYLEETKAQKAELIYFAGCMTHLTPAIKKSMTNLLSRANIDYWFMDEDKAPCCGRPLMQAGQYEAAKKLINNNQKKILDSGAKTIVVSCPICYKVFNEDYVLPGISVHHHSDFLLSLIDQGKLQVHALNQRVVYHDPCELGRGSNIYMEPRKLLKKFSVLIPMKKEKENAFCCGGSLANIKITNLERYKIRDKALKAFQSYKPDLLISSCPLCKKTFSTNNPFEVCDIAEIVWQAVLKSDYQRQNNIREKQVLTLSEAIQEL
jgi:Fe-S oxidoreductase